MWPGGKATEGPRFDPLRLSFLFKNCGLLTLSCDLAHAINATLKWLTQLPTLIQNHSGGDSVASIGVRYKIPDPPTSPSLIRLNGFCGRKSPCFLPEPQDLMKSGIVEDLRRGGSPREVASGGFIHGNGKLKLVCSWLCVYLRAWCVLAH